VAVGYGLGDGDDGAGLCCAGVSICLVEVERAKEGDEPESYPMAETPAAKAARATAKNFILKVVGIKGILSRVDDL
jgi:hypothetical protein